jgi:hypothetical protein
LAEGIERLEREILQVIPAKCKHLNKSFQHHQRQR